MAMSIRGQALKRTLLFILLLIFPVCFMVSFLVQVLLDLSFPDDYQGITSLLRVSVFSAIGACTGSGIVTYFAFRNLYDPNYDRVSPVDTSTYIEMRLPYQAAFDSCLASLRQLGKASILEEDRVNGAIEATIVPLRWWEQALAWGQRVSFRLGSDQESSTKILVTSRAPLSTIAIDFGQNQRNIERLTASLRKEVEK